MLGAHLLASSESAVASAKTRIPLAKRIRPRPMVNAQMRRRLTAGRIPILSASRLTAGAAGLLILSPCAERPARSGELWRKGWDSNPRTTCAVAGFQDRCLKPLGHPSISLILLNKSRYSLKPQSAAESILAPPLCAPARPKREGGADKGPRATASRMGGTVLRLLSGPRRRSGFPKHGGC